MKREPTAYPRSVLLQETEIVDPTGAHPGLTDAFAFLEGAFDPGSGFPSYVAPGGDFNKRVLSPPEIFSSLIIAQSLVDLGLRPGFVQHLPAIVEKAANANGFIHFFFDRNLLVADLDCTAVAYSLLMSMGFEPPFLEAVVDKMVENVNDDGIIEVYEKPAGEHEGRIDACVLVNALYFLHSVERAGDAAPSEQLVFETLTQRSYLLGTRYYPSPDAFLYFLSRLVSDFPETRERYLAELFSALYERQSETGSYMDLALRYAAMDNLGTCEPEQRRDVLKYRMPSGGWKADSFFKYGRRNLYFGGEPLSTGLGIRAAVKRPTRRP